MKDIFSLNTFSATIISGTDQSFPVNSVYNGTESLLYLASEKWESFLTTLKTLYLSLKMR